MDTCYLFQIQILPVSLSDAQPKSLDTTLLFTFSISCMYVDVWMCVHNQVAIWKRMYVHVHTHMWKSEVNLGCCFLGVDKLVFRYNTGKQSSLIRLGWITSKLLGSLVLFHQCWYKKHMTPCLVITSMPETGFQSSVLSGKLFSQ